MDADFFSSFFQATNHILDRSGLVTLVTKKMENKLVLAASVCPELYSTEKSI